MTGRGSEQHSDPAPGGGPREVMPAARRQGKTGWMLASGLVIFMVALGIWMDRLQATRAPSTGADEPKSEREPVPDGLDSPGAPVAVAFGAPKLERCIPWHVSAAEPPAPAGAKTLIVTSRVADPYGYTLGGFEQECGQGQPLLVIEDLKPGQLKALVSKKAPEAILAVSLPAAERAVAEAPQVPLLYAMVQAPSAAGLDRPGAVGVLPWVPMEPVVRHVLKVLPRKHTALAVLYPPGAFAELAGQVAAAIRAAGRKAELVEVSAENLDRALDEAARAQAWIVLPDRAVIDYRLFNRIQVAAERDRVPVCVPDEAHVRAGAYAGVGVDSNRVGRQLCHLAGALARGELPAGDRIFCPEYSFAVVYNAQVEKLGYILDPAQLDQAKLYKWH